MSEHYRTAAARLRALTLATPGVIEFADVLEAEDASRARIREAASALGDHDRAQAVAFLIEVRHEHTDAAETDAAEAIAELIRVLAQEHWGKLA